MAQLRLPLVCLAALLPLAAALHAQEPATPLPPTALNGQAPSRPNASNTLTRTTRLVVLDAVVIDKKGNAVTDLKRDEFRITDNDVPQEIRFFETPGKFTPAQDLTIDSTADLDRLAPRAPVNIIVLDEFNTLFEDMAFARYSLKKFLDSQPEKLPTPTMLVAVSLTKFEVLHDYTQNRQAILDSLDHHFGGNPWQAAGGQWRGERRALALMTLSRVAEATIGHIGHKNMIWLGRGFPTSAHLVNTTDEEAALHSATVRVINELRDARVTLYTIDPAGLMSDPGKYGEGAALFAPFGGDPDFQQIATATGGRNLYGRNDVDAEVGTAIRDSAGLYALVYRPTADPDGKTTQYHSIKVTTTRPGLSVITRQGYFPEMRPAQLRADGTVSRKLQTELATAATGNMNYDAVAFAVKPKPNEPGSFIVSIDGGNLPWATYNGGVRMLKAIVLTTTFDKKGKEIKAEAQEIAAHAPENVAAGTRITQGIGVAVKIAPDAKAVRARIVVRLLYNGRMGAVDFPLDGTLTEIRSRAVKDPAPAPQTISQPVSQPAPQPEPQP